MPRNLVLCCDGTNNQFGDEYTNVVRLIQVLDRDETKQRVFYDAGVGTLPEPGWATWVGQRLSTIYGLGFGGGLERNVQEAYTFLMNYWEPGDRVYLFGFSRGAYTVRVLAGMLHALGLLPRGSEQLVPYLMRIFKAIREGNRDQRRDNFWRLCSTFRWTFARDVGTKDRDFPVHFLGLWDTVSSVGWFWNPASYRFTRRNPSVSVVRQALAIDERRCFYRQNSFGRVKGQDLKEHWFPGAHSDVGGGYPADEGGLWRLAFEWMLNEARSHGLQIDDARVDRVLGKAPEKAWLEPLHDELGNWKWWPLEVLPKRRWDYRTRGRRWSMGLGRRRRIPNGARLDRTAVLRIREDLNYSPPNLSTSFLRKLRNLEDVGESVAVES